MKLRNFTTRVWMLVSLLAACRNDPGITLPEPMQGADASATAGDTSLPLPDADRIAVCDQATDGTPCGENGQQHCVLGVCADNVCGDTVTAGDEECDDGNEEDGDTCTADCRFGYVCRDGMLDPGEECDDGNRINDDGCSNGCTLNVCGNMRLDAGEECDDGNQLDEDACSNRCTINACGNLRRDPGEACDGDSLEAAVCKADCSGYEEDTCSPCVEQQCSDYLGLNVFAGCRIEVNRDFVMTPMEGFIEKCTALDECVRTRGCSDDTDFAPCLCGSLSLEECHLAEQAPGPCADHFPVATGCDTSETRSTCALSLSQDLTLPSGFAYFLDQCRRTLCKDECSR